MIRKRELDFGISGQKRINGIVYDVSSCTVFFLCRFPVKLPQVYIQKESIFMNPSSEDFHEMLFFVKFFVIFY